MPVLSAHVADFQQGRELQDDKAGYDKAGEQIEWPGIHRSAGESVGYQPRKRAGRKTGSAKRADKIQQSKCVKPALSACKYV